MSDSDELLGAHGDNWCVVPSSFGPPDQMNEYVMRWLVIPGPPMSCTLVHQFASPEPPEQYAPYHMHPQTFSIHICLAGKGHHYAEGQMNVVEPGTIFYEGPGVSHTVVAAPGHSLLQVCIQYPSLGYEDETRIVPEAGTLDRWRDLQTFIERFGPAGEKYKQATAGMYKSERWVKYVTQRQQKTK